MQGQQNEQENEESLFRPKVSLVELLSEERLEALIAGFHDNIVHTENTTDRQVRSGVPYAAFTALITKITAQSLTEEWFKQLCSKINTGEDEVIDSNDFMNYLLQQLRTKVTKEESVILPLQEAPVFKRNVYSKQTTCRLILVASPAKALSISKDGVISTWTTGLTLQSAFSIDQPSSASHKVAVWVTDCALLDKCGLLAIATVAREIAFYDITTSTPSCIYKLIELNHVPMCMCAYSSDEKINGANILVYGDQAGHISVLHFKKPREGLFMAQNEKETMQVIHFNRLPDHHTYVAHIHAPLSHTEWVQKVTYTPHNNSIISCANSSNKSVIVQDIYGKRKPYVFNLNKGVSCFVYSQKMELLVTGSLDHLVYLWDPYMSTRAIGILRGHTSSVVDLVIHKPKGLLLSYSNNSVLCVWDILEQSCLQKIVLDFPVLKTEYSSIVLTLQNDSNLLITCKDYIAQMEISSSPLSQKYGTTTHKTPLVDVIYNAKQNQVVSGCEGGDVIVWDLSSGNRVSQLSKTSEGNEGGQLCALSCDSTEKMCLTAFLSGEIKVWSISNGECLKFLQVPYNTEVTGLAHVPERRQFVSVGWNKRITAFSADSKNFKVPPSDSWSGPNHHKDDITCLAHCSPHYLVTGSFDGDIILWNTDTERKIVQYKTLSKIRAPFILKSLKKASLSNSSRTSTVMSHNSSRPASRASRRMSAYHLRSTSLIFQHVPVDQILFLKSRMANRQEGVAVLVTSEGGQACFRELLGGQDVRGSFPLTNSDEDSVLAMATNISDQFLVGGDTAGNIAVYDIGEYCIGITLTKIDATPKYISSWKAHSAEVTSVCVADGQVTQPLIVSASADCDVHLWSIHGEHVGRFGQNTLVTIAIYFEVEAEVIGVEVGMIGIESSTPPIPVDITLKEQHWILGSAPFSKMASTNPSEAVQEGPTGTAPTMVSQLTTTLEPELTVRDSSQHSDHAQESNGDSYHTQASSKKTLGDHYEAMALKRLSDKQLRRSHYAGIDEQSMKRFSSLCSPYQALTIQDVDDIKLPSTLSSAIQQS